MIKIFAHRGYSIDNIRENSVKALDLAVDNNFSGIEIDLHFVDNQWIAVHDSPDLKNLRNLDNLDEFLRYQDKLLYWLDFKNLQDLGEEDLQKALLALKNSIKDSGCNLKQFYFAPFITNLNIAEKIYNKIRTIISPDAKIMAVCNKIDPAEYESYYSRLVNQNIEYLSIKHHLINVELIAIFQNIDIFAWAVNDLSDAKRLTQEFGLENFTTDDITVKKFNEA